MQQSAHEYLQHGQNPFFRLPSGTLTTDAAIDVALLGVPHDGGIDLQGRLCPPPSSRHSREFTHHRASRRAVLGSDIVDSSQPPPVIGVPGGLAAREALAFLRALRGVRVVGAV